MRVRLRRRRRSGETYRESCQSMMMWPVQGPTEGRDWGRPKGCQPIWRKQAMRMLNLRCVFDWSTVSVEDLPDPFYVRPALIPAQ